MANRECGGGLVISIEGDVKNSLLQHPAICIEPVNWNKILLNYRPCLCCAAAVCKPQKFRDIPSLNVNRIEPITCHLPWLVPSLMRRNTRSETSLSGSWLGGIMWVPSCQHCTGPLEQAEQGVQYHLKAFTVSYWLPWIGSKVTGVYPSP